jgi:hypothetical protein
MPTQCDIHDDLLLSLLGLHGLIIVIASFVLDGIAFGGEFTVAEIALMFGSRFGLVISEQVIATFVNKIEGIF